MTNKEKAIERLNALENEAKELRKIIEQPTITKEQRFWELMQKIDRPFLRKEGNPYSIYFFSGNSYFLEIEKTNLWVSYKNIWSVFETEFIMNHVQTQAFIKNMVEEHFKMKGLTPEMFSE